MKQHDVRVSRAYTRLSDNPRIDMLFRERALWLFGTAYRLGDLRRLVNVYDRAPESVFTSGEYFMGGTYGSDLNLPFPLEGADWAGTGVTGCQD